MLAELGLEELVEVEVEGGRPMPTSRETERLRGRVGGEEASARAARKAVGMAEKVALPDVLGTARWRGRALTGSSRKAVR